MTEDREQMTDDREQRTDDRRQMAEDRIRNTNSEFKSIPIIAMTAHAIPS
jgi:hypothetical protein